jgi:hypothetical protein
MKHDFQALEAAVWAATSRDAGTPPPAPELQWCTAYPDAIEQALLKADFVPLLRLLESAEAVHPILLPALADAVRARGLPRRAGRKPKLTTAEARVVAGAVALRRWEGQGITDAILDVALDFELSTSTVKRAFEAKVPPHRRPGHQLVPKQGTNPGAA